MNIETAEELKQLTLQEIEYRTKWRAAVAVLQSLVQPVTDHNQRCCEFWQEHLPESEEVVVLMDNLTTYKIKKPEREVATQEAFLPYGIDFEECKLINVIS